MSNALTSAQQAAAADKKKLQKIKDIRTRISSFKSQLARFSSEMDAMLAEVGVAKAQWDVFHPTFRGDNELALARRETELNNELSALLGTMERPDKGTIRWLQKEIDKLQKRESADKARMENIKTIQSRISKIGPDLERIKNEIAQITGPEKEAYCCCPPGTGGRICYLF